MSHRPDDAVARWIRRRPLALFALCYLAGMLIGLYARLPVWVWAMGAGVTAAGLLAFRRRALVFGLAVVCGALLVGMALNIPQGPESRGAAITGAIASEPVDNGETISLKLTNVSVDGELLPYDMQVYLYHEDHLEPPVLQYGAAIAFTGRTWIPQSGNGPGQFDYRLHLLRRGIGLGANGSTAAFRVLAEPEPSLMGLSLQVKAKLSAVLEEQYQQHAPIMKALLLGDKRELSTELVEDFRKAGVVHILAISGLHINFLALMIDWLLRMLRFPNRAAYFATCLILLLYAGIVGFAASVIRALVMYALMAGGRAFGRPNDSLTGLSAAFLLLTLVNPLSVTDPGLALSFSAVLGILCLTPILMPALHGGDLPAPVFKFSRWALGSLALTAGIQLAILPATVAFYHEFPLYGIAVNLLVIPLTTLALPLAFAALPLGFVFPALGGLLAQIPKLLIDMTIQSVEIASRLPMATIQLPSWPVWLVLIYGALVFLCSPYVRLKLRVRRILIPALPLLCLLAVGLAKWSQGGGLELVFLDVGQADAAVVQVQDATYLIDVGTGSQSADYLLHTGRRADGVFLSHPHSDHAGGFDPVLALSERGTLYLPVGWGAVEHDESLGDLVARAEARGWSVVYLGAGKSLELSREVTMEVLYPSGDAPPEDANWISQVLLIQYGEGSALFTGDLPAQAESIAFPDCDVLKVAHHGSGNSSGVLLLRMTTPSVAVISAGRNNAYGHPSPDALNRLELVGAQVYRTDLHGTISVRVQPDGALDVTTWTRPEAE